MSKQIDNSGRSLSLRSRWVLRRNAVLGSAAFQRWAARVPIFRGVARRRAAAQFDLVAGFVYTQVLTAMVESGLIDHMRARLVTLSEAAAFTGLPDAAAERLLKAAQALDMCESPEAGLWTLGEQGAALSANPGAMAMIRHHRLLYADLADLLALLAKDRQAETNLSAYWTYASKGGAGQPPTQPDAQPASGPDYSALMAATQPMVSHQILEAYPFARHRRMLDIGGGTGAFVSAIAQAAPALEFGIFDLPEVVAKARGLIDLALPGRSVTPHPGSFKQDPIPTGYDLITLCRIVHDHDDDAIDRLLKNIHAALPPGGRLLIVEPMAEMSGAERMGHAYFGLYLWAMNSGQPRTLAQISAMLRRAGFTSTQTIKTPLPIITSAIVAFK